MSKRTVDCFPFFMKVGCVFLITDITDLSVWNEDRQDCPCCLLFCIHHLSKVFAIFDKRENELAKNTIRAWLELNDYC